MRALIAALAALALVPAAAAGQTPTYGYVEAGTALRATPADGAAVALVSDGTAGEIVRRRDVAATAWTQLRIGDVRGWVPDELVRAASAPLPAALRARLEALAEPGRTGTMFAELDTGQVLFAADEDRRYVLASVTKLFTVAAAAGSDRLDPGLAARILLPSDNRLADRLARRLGSGNLHDGAQRAASFALAHAAPVSLSDGSGLSRRNQASPEAVVDFLAALDLEPHMGDVFASLPVAGRSGTLAGRMRGSAAAGRCAAKTGTLHDVSTLAGICVTRSHRRVAFAVFMNRCVVWRARSRQDAMLRALVALDAS